MEQSQIQQKVTHFIEESLALQQIFRNLPEGTQMNVSVSERIDLHIYFHDGRVQTGEGHLATADALYSIDAEVFRRLGDRNPSDISDFYAEFGRETLAGRIRITLLKPVSHFLSHKYLEFLKNLAPALQGEILQKLMIGAGQASSWIDSLKQSFRPRS